MDSLVPVIVFFLILFTIELVYYGFATVRTSEAKQVKKRLSAVRPAASETAPVHILRRRKMSDLPWLDRLLQGISPIQRLDNLLVQANLNIPVALLLLTSALMLIIVYHASSVLIRDKLLSLALAGVFAYLPFFYVRIKKAKRMERFQRQLPDALELIARTMRAGHAFTGGLKMVSEEFDDPMGPEFQRMLDEINFGVSVPDALKNLSDRIDCSDIKYFVVSVIIQRDTGGNLAEIIDNIGRVIRERFKFEGKVRVLSAEGRYTAVLLFVLPFLVAAALYVLNPKLMLTLVEDPIGRILTATALILMVFGALVTRKMIRIQV